MATQNCCNNTLNAYTTGSTLTVTTGNANVSAGNLKVPTTTASVGIIKWATATRIFTGTTRSYYSGPNVGNLSTLTTADNTICGGAASNGTGAASAFSSNTIKNTGVIHQGGMRQFTTGANDNTLLGFGLDSQVTGATFNTAMGSTACRGSANSYNCCLGQGPTGSASINNSNIILANIGAAAANRCYLGENAASPANAKITTCYIAGIANSTVTGSAVVINGTSFQCALAVSSKRYKDDIQDMGSQSSAVITLRPVTFKYIKRENETKNYGLIAEEVLNHCPDLVEYDASGEINTVAYHLLNSMLLSELHKQSLKLKNLFSRTQILLGSS